MRQLGNIIESKNLNHNLPKVVRKAARGVILENQKLLLVYCKAYNDYTFPGGGIEEGESSLDAVKRECLEEVGAILSDIKPLFQIEEQEEKPEGYIYDHISEYYLCKLDKMVSNHLCDYEIKLGFEPVWMDIDETIRLDEAKYNLFKEKDYEGVIERELRVLYYLKGVLKNE